MLSRTIRPSHHPAHCFDQPALGSICLFQPRPLPRSIILATFKVRTSIRRYARPAPSTRRAAKASKRALENRIDPDRQRRQSEALEDIFGESLDRMHRLGAMRATASQALAFLEDFAVLVDEVEARLPTVDLERFRAMQSKHSTNDQDCLTIAQHLQRAGAHAFPIVNSIWQYLARTLSRSGYVPGTLWVMGSIREAARGDESLFHSVMVKHPLQHLREIAQTEDGDYRAKTLLGNIEHMRGNEIGAIDLWTKAMHSAEASMKTPQLSFSSRLYRRIKRSLGASRRVGGHGTDSKSLSQRRADNPHTKARAGLLGFSDPFQLESPWIELALIHQDRTRRGFDETGACREALDVGCRLDDPLAHYYKALHSKVTDAEGNHLATSTWLYHIIKAAVSGHARAMFELGVFYTESGWKYIEDEPPDHVKPTAFDSYPIVAKSSLFGRIRQILHLQRIPRNSAEDDIFRTAIHPHTEENRYAMGMSWCNLAILNGYAPAALFYVRLCLERNRWAAASAPESAVRLLDSRYTYATKEDFVVKKPRSDLPKNDAEMEDKPNSLYSKHGAANHLRYFFHAYQAYKLRKEYRQQAKHKTNSRKAVRDEERFLASQPGKYRMWHLNKEVRDSYEDDFDRLNAEAQAICDENNFFIYDDDEQLMYEPKSGRYPQYIFHDNADGYIMRISSEEISS